MTILWLAVVLLIGQGLLAIALMLAVHTFGVYTERLRKTYQQNVVIRLNLATMENEIAVREAARKYPLPREERA